jgi:aldehyde dehydrogenase (NAD+)
MTNKDEIKIDFATEWKYAPAPESADHVKLKSRYELFIDGEFVAPKKGKYFETVNPSRETKLAEVADATAEDVDRAAKAARRAYERVWSKMPARERGKENTFTGSLA